MGSCTIDQYGFRRQKANPVSRVGVFPYTGEQIDHDGKLKLQKDKIYWVYRGPEELFAPDALESFNGIPIRVGHVMLGSTNDKFKTVDDEPADGCIFNVRQSMDMPDILIAEFAIWTEKMKDVLAKGKVKQLSLGYCCQYVPEQGNYRGQPYEFKQIRLRGNHLALVEHGRCGSSVCVCDEAIITFDSLPEEILKMDNEAKKAEQAKRLAEAVKNCDEEACRDCLDFYDLTPEQRKDALAYIKGKAEKPSEAKAEDSCGKGKETKDEVPPPPPAPEEEKKVGEQKKEETPAATEPAKTEAESPAVATEPKKEETPAPAEAPKTEDKPVQDCNVAPQTATTPTAQVPVQSLQSVSAAKKDEKKEEENKAEEPKKEESTAPAKDEASASAGAVPPAVKPQVPPDNGNTAEQPKQEGSLAAKPEIGTEKDIKVEPTPTKDDALTNPPNKENSAAKPSPDAGLPHNDEPTAPDNHIDPKVQTADAAPAEGDKKVETPAGEEKKDEGKKEEVPPAPAATAQDEASQYAKFAAEYSRTQMLAEQIRPLVPAFDSALMREVDVARYAAKHIDCLAFACDEADAVVLAAVKGHIAALAQKKEAAKPKTFAMVGDEAIPAVQPKKDVSAKAALDKYYHK